MRATERLGELLAASAQQRVPNVLPRATVHGNCRASVLQKLIRRAAGGNMSLRSCNVRAESDEAVPPRYSARVMAAPGATAEYRYADSKEELCVRAGCARADRTGGGNKL